MKEYECSICMDTNCILVVKSSDKTTTPNRCPNWMGIAKWIPRVDLEDKEES